MDQPVNLIKMIDTIIHQLSKCYGFHLKFSELAANLRLVLHILLTTVFLILYVQMFMIKTTQYNSIVWPSNEITLNNKILV